MNKETYLRLPNITVVELQNVVNYLEENNIKYVEYYENEHKLEQALDEIEKYIENHKRESELHIYGLTIPKFVFNGDIEDIEEIIKKAKGDVKNESKS